MNKKLFVAIGSLVFLTSLGLVLSFFYAPFFRGVDGYGDSLAVTTIVANEVQRKAADSLTWSPLRTQDQLYQNDSVLTGISSSTEIKFHLGHVLNLGPNTLVSIQLPAKPEEPITLLLTNGQYQLRIAKNERVRLNDLTVRFVSTSLIIVDRTKAHTKFELVEGQAEIIDRITGTLVQSFQVGAPVLLSEAQIEEILPVKIEEVKKTKKTWEAPLHEARGERIKSKILGPKIALKFPQPGKTVQAKTPVMMAWAPNSVVEVYNWEIARDPEFVQVVDSGETFETTITVDNLPPGRLYWRVQGRDEEGIFVSEDEIWSLDVQERQPATADVSEHTIPVSQLQQAQKVKPVTNQSSEEQK